MSSELMEGPVVCACGRQVEYVYPVRIGIGSAQQGWIYVCGGCLAIEQACFGEPETVRRLGDAAGVPVWDRMCWVLDDAALSVVEIAALTGAHERVVRKELSNHRAELAVVEMNGKTKVWGLRQ